MREKFDLKQMLEEIEKDKNLSRQKNNKMSQDDILKMIQEKKKREKQSQ
jgi:hypothetical protein